MAQYPAHYGYGLQPIPQQYQQGGGAGASPQSLQMILAWLLANQQEQGGQPEQAAGPPINPYMAQPLRPSLTGLSPLGRFNDMVLRQSGELASRTADAKSAVAETSERQRLVDSITHPPPMAPYSIDRPPVDLDGSGNGFSTAPATLTSRYGTGGVSFAPPGTVPHGTFGPDHLPFGQIGGPNEAQPTSGDPEQTTFQQQMILDSVNKALGKKKKG